MVSSKAAAARTRELVCCSIEKAYAQHQIVYRLQIKCLRKFTLIVKSFRENFAYVVLWQCIRANLNATQYEARTAQCTNIGFYLL